jgi:hypothetical protein
MPIEVLTHGRSYVQIQIPWAYFLWDYVDDYVNTANLQVKEEAL